MIITLFYIAISRFALALTRDLKSNTPNRKSTIRYEAAHRITNKTCPAHKSRLFPIPSTMFGFWYSSSLISTLCMILHYPVLLSMQGPKIDLKTFRSNINSLFCCILWSVQVSHPYITTGRTSFLYSCTSRLLDNILDSNNNNVYDRKAGCRMVRV